ncbi:cytochrome d ubiquinol oxidase subunit II [Bacillus marinisedimentorum]|uniref:cytochrome d ubiquinol oxidase subunit II n=1 Tax=Bacillus marinisedimentorum TaxID=1821260 RepID=UPI0007E0856E|nr:cytochrome d ubiquinol oxidase subunit II [Bacillus marinisedimentorum]
MADSLLAVTLLWSFVFIYSIFATIDFGAGFWSMVYYNRPQTKATRIANRYLSPSWEVTNVFIVLIVVALVSFFPGATFVLGTVLLIPGSAIVILLAVRSAFLVFSHSAPRFERMLVHISGITGVLIPALLISVLPLSHGGLVTDSGGVFQLDFAAFFLRMEVYAFMIFAVLSTLFLSSLLLADYSYLAEEMNAYQIYRKDALLLGPAVLAAALFIVLAVRAESNWLFSSLFEYRGWLGVSVLLFFAGYGALFIQRRRGHAVKGIPRLAVLLIVSQFLTASYAYGSAHLPYMIYPIVTIESGFTHPNMFRALFVTYIAGFLVLMPGFYYFWKLFLKDKRYIGPDH